MPTAHLTQVTAGGHILIADGNITINEVLVPTTASEEERLLRNRPPGWEYMLFASAMKQKKEQLQFKWHDHEAGIAPQQLVTQYRTTINKSEVLSYASNALGELKEIAKKINRILGPVLKDRAFGGIGEPGDSTRIRHLGDRVAGMAEPGCTAQFLGLDS